MFEYVCLCTLIPIEVNAIANKISKKKILFAYHAKWAWREITHTGSKIKKKSTNRSIPPVLYCLEMLRWKYFLWKKQGKRQIHKNMQSRLAAHTKTYSQQQQSKKKNSVRNVNNFVGRNNIKKNGSKATMFFLNKRVTANSTINRSFLAWNWKKTI